VPERPTNPPPAFPVQELRTPNFRDGFYTTLVNRSSDAYQKTLPIKRGTPYASILGADQRVIDRFSANPLYFLRELRPGNSSSSDFGNTSDWVIWIWATQQIAQSNYNADIDYPEEDVTVSRFSRAYEIKRQVYEASPTVGAHSTLTALVAVAITAPGINYNQATGTVGTGAIAEAVCYNGAIIDWIVTKEGTGVTTGAALTITGDGTGATAVARVQPVTALLIHQEKKEYPPDNPRSHDYVQVIRVYEILPGVETITKGYDQSSGSPVRIVKQRVTPATDPEVLNDSRTIGSFTGFVTDSKVVPVDGMGTTVAIKTTIYMTLPSSELTIWDQDEETLVNIATTYQVIKIDGATAPTQTAGFIINDQKIDGTTFLRIKRDFTEFLEFEYEEQRFAGGSFPDLWDYFNFFWTNGCGSFNYERSQFSDYVQTRVTIYFTNAVQAIVGLTIQPNTIQLGHAVNQVNVLNDAGSIIYAEPDCTGTVTFPASDPSYTDYLDDIQGTFQLRSGESTLWKALYWKNIEVEIWML
jgi:hypothetical protein